MFTNTEILIYRHILLFPPDEEPEEDLTLEQIEEKAKAGDARAQTRVSVRATVAQL